MQKTNYLKKFCIKKRRIQIIIRKKKKKFKYLEIIR